MVDIEIPRFMADKTDTILGVQYDTGTGYLNHYPAPFGIANRWTTTNGTQKVRLVVSSFASSIQKFAVPIRMIFVLGNTVTQQSTQRIYAALAPADRQ